MHLRKRADVIPLPPKPVVVKASGDFDGNDGRWSTFFINVNSDNEGLNGQNFKVLISTSSSLTLLPAQNEWCDKECAARRGVLIYNGQQVLGLGDDNWQKADIAEIPLPYWYSKDLLGDNSTLSGTWGITNVGLGQSSNESLVLADRYAVKYLFDDFFMGSFGLAAGKVGGDGATKTTWLSQFKDDGNVASSSYGYTAGAWYRNNHNGVPGSLVLGGYDKSRMAGTGLSIRMPNSDNNTLAVGVPSILYEPDQDVEANTASFTEECGGFRANIDSTLPYLILPDCICDKFQQNFGLSYDENQNLYFIDSSSHDRNAQLNATITFKIAEGPQNNVKFTNIILPYDAFDQQIGSATGENFTTYFPIKKSKDGVYTLGRTFLQEAHIIVDYERANFTVSPAYYSDLTPQESLVTIFNTSYSLPNGPSNPSGGLAPGAIAGTVVGIVIAFLVAGVIAFCWWRKRKNRKEAALKANETSEIDPTLAGQEIKYRRVSELTGSDLPSSPKSPLGGYYTADHKSIPPISEMSPDSPPVELYSPPTETASDVDGRDYFTAGKVRRRGAQRDRDSSGHNTPGIPIAELPGDEGQFYTPGAHFDAVSPVSSPLHTRGPSDTSLSTNIDERLADHKQGPTGPVHSVEAATADKARVPEDETQIAATTEAQVTDTTEAAAERRPSHTRGLSDTTIASDSTAVSQPTPEEQERWAKEPRRPLSG